MDVARRLRFLAALIVAAGGALGAVEAVAQAACCTCSSSGVTVYNYSGNQACHFVGTECECRDGESTATCQANCVSGVNLGELVCSGGGWDGGQRFTVWTCSGDTQCSKRCGFGGSVSVCADGQHTYVVEGEGTCPSAGPCDGVVCRSGRVCSGGACACPGSEHIHLGPAACHARTIGHTCPGGQHKPGHSISGCHANHGCPSNSTGTTGHDCACNSGYTSSTDDGVLTCTLAGPCDGVVCRSGRVCSGGACACPGSEHIHLGPAACHARTIGHTCPGGQHKPGHSISGCHANHVCTGDQTGGGGGRLRGPVVRRRPDVERRQGVRGPGVRRWHGVGRRVPVPDRRDPGGRRVQVRRLFQPAVRRERRLSGQWVRRQPGGAAERRVRRFVHVAARPVGQRSLHLS